ncbi:unnamed protein product [Brassica oleracea]|uniref:(rape) hypothetical protein n=1 Tax=Brassica napus TaxID=3708 RepID=A0A816Q6L1_BRANA|nr:unnamed protein product [Brassica napus]
MTQTAVQGDATEETDESNRSNKSSNAASIFTLDPLEGPRDEKDGSGDEDEEQKRLQAEELRLVSTISHDCFSTLLPRDWTRIERKSRERLITPPMSIYKQPCNFSVTFAF